MRMSAAAYVGRVGGLAVALGIGLAVASGYGLASAETSGETGSDSSSASSSPGSSASSSSGATSSDATTSGASSASASSASKRAGTTVGPSSSSTASTSAGTDESLTGSHSTSSDGSNLENGQTATSQRPNAPSTSLTSGDLKNADTENPEPATEVSDNEPGFVAATPKKPSDARPRATIQVSPTTQPAAPLDTINETPAQHAVSTLSVVVPSTVGTADLVSEPATEQRPAAPTDPAPRDPVEVVTTALSTVVSALVNPAATDVPTAPIDSPAIWALAAAARREFAAATPSLAPAVDPVTNSLTTGATLAAIAQAPVVAIEQTPPLAFLQQLPVVGPLFVTPIVAVIHQIPIVSDILHPFIGYPVQIGLPAGTPVPRDVWLTSFDGTRINVHFMPAIGLQAGQKAPTILSGPGLGMPGATNLHGTPLDDILTDALGYVSVATLRHAGYNVVTWDPRGEYFSGGRLELNSPQFEGRDVSAIISWLATQPEAGLDAPGDPRIGMVGPSYGGGIQVVTASIDKRVDAIVPSIAYHSLTTALYRNEAFRSSWGTLLTGALIAHRRSRQSRGSCLRRSTATSPAC